MSSDSQSTANYAAVIRDLKAKRDELNRTISVLEALALRPPVEGAVAVVTVGNTETAPQISEIRTREFAEARDRRAKELTATPVPNVGIGEACVYILRTRPGALLSTRQITNLLIGGGFPLNVINPINNVWSALAHRARSKGDIERIGREWRYVESEKAEASIAVPVAESHLNGAARHQ